MVILPVDLCVKVNLPGVGIKGDPLYDHASLERPRDLKARGLAVPDDPHAGHLIQMPVLLRVVIRDLPCVPGPGNVLKGGKPVARLPLLDGFPPGNLVIDTGYIVVLIKDYSDIIIFHPAARLVHRHSRGYLRHGYHFIALCRNVFHPDLSFLGLHQTAGSERIAVEYQQAAPGPDV